MISPAAHTSPPLDTTHHKFGPSSLKNREICAGWKNDQTGDKTAADEGTLMHDAAERGDLKLLNAEQSEQVTKVINYTARMVESAIMVVREARLEILHGQTFGTADLVVLRKLKNGKLHIDVVDYKFGWVTVDDAEENRQGFAYVLGAWDQPGLWQEAESCTMTFLAPRRDEVSKHTFYRIDLPRISLVVANILARANHYEETHDAAMLRLNEINCTYCGRKPTCPLMIEYGLAHARKYRPLEIAEEVHSSQISDPAKMAQFFIALKILEKLVDSGKKHVAEFALQHEIPGFVRRERKGKITITDSNAAYPILLRIFGVDNPEDKNSGAMMNLIRCATFSYSDILKFVSDQAPKGKERTKAVGALYTALQEAECVQLGEPTTYLQREKEEAPTDIESTVIPPPELPAPAPKGDTGTIMRGPAVD